MGSVNVPTCIYFTFTYPFPSVRLKEKRVGKLHQSYASKFKIRDVTSRSAGKLTEGVVRVLALLAFFALIGNYSCREWYI